MLELCRTVRFCISLGRPGGASPVHNAFAGWPAMEGLGAYYELHVACTGDVDPTTGYATSIDEIDRAVRDRAIPYIARTLRERPQTDPPSLLPGLLDLIQPSLDQRVTSLEWQLTPYYSLTMHAESPQRVLLRQQFDFAAAHRLHCPTLSDAENQAIFGRCNNPNGHGHNYRLEVAASTPLDDPGALRLPVLERIVDEVVVRRFDHTHLNLDTAEFSDRNPSLEHITAVCHDLLAEPIADAGGCLESVTVWETPKTRCTVGRGQGSGIRG